MMRWIGPNAKRFRTQNVTPNETRVQIIRPGTTLIRSESASGSIGLDEDEGEQAAEQAVEDDRLGECESEPHDPLQLAAQLRLASDRGDHVPEDVPDTDSGANGA